MSAIPQPLVSVVVTLLWLILTSFTVGQLVMGILVGLLTGAAFARISPEPIRPRHPRSMLTLFLRVAGDIIRSNYAVARLIVTRGRHHQRRSGFVRIPLEMTRPDGLAVLAIIVTATPGTAWIEYEPRTGILLLHVFDLLDQDDWTHIIKSRYESLLMEIFE